MISLAADELSRSFDGTAPGIVLTSQASAVVYDTFTVTATFSEAVSGFTIEDVTVGNGTVSGFVEVVPGLEYSFDVTLAAYGEVTVDIGAAGAHDAASNPSTAAATLTRFDGGDAPIADDAGFNLDENAAKDTVVGSVTASDADAPGQTLSYAIVAGNTDGAFAIDPDTGEITVANAAAVDFETNPSFILTVQVTDSGEPSLSDTADITITVNNVIEGTITGYVWQDLNADGFFTLDEGAFADVIVRPFSSDNVEWSWTQTDAIGGYYFEDPGYGEWYLVFEAPSGYHFNPWNNYNWANEQGISPLVTLTDEELLAIVNAGLTPDELPG